MSEEQKARVIDYKPKVIDPNIRWNPQYKELKPKGIVLHAMLSDFGDLSAWEFLESKGLSAHAFITPEGFVVKGQDDDKVAYHAGRSRHGSLTNLNYYYLGVEVLLDRMPYRKWLESISIKDPYSQFTKLINTVDWVQSLQLDALVWWCADMINKYDIPLENIVYHSEVSGDDVRGEGKGKVDPGKTFPKYEFDKYLKQRLNE